MKTFPSLASLLVSCTCILCLAPAYSQKLPDQQELGLRAPATLKIDGKTTEWNDTFQAYNKTTQVFYTIANDDDNLYLAVQASNTSIISKIMSGGITFTISTSGKKKDKDGVSITFPVPGKSSMRDMMTSMRPAFEKMQGADPATMKKTTDSLMYAMNRQQIDKLKDIKVLGIKDIPDSMLSIYNEEGIKARSLFDAKGAYNYELAIPLKYLGISANDGKEFLYDIKLNGLMATMGMPGGGAVRVDGGGGGNFGGGGGGGFSGGGAGPGGARVISIGGPGGMDIMSMISPTDFWGKYTPAKK